MKITFVIAEYNPFHTGHLFQLRAAKEQTNADKLAVIMSGSVTERGDFAVCGKKNPRRMGEDCGRRRRSGAPDVLRFEQRRKVFSRRNENRIGLFKE